MSPEELQILDARPSASLWNEGYDFTKTEEVPSFSQVDPLGIIQRSPKYLVNLSHKYLNKYGFGTCGPRGFYGTTMEHLRLEETLAQFFVKESAIFYAQGVSVASSVLAALITVEDLVFCFQKVNYGIKSGLRLNGKTTILFVSCIEELENWLIEWGKIERVGNSKELVYLSDATSDPKPLPSSFTALDGEIRPLKEYKMRYVVTEGMFMSDGSFCDLPELVRLRRAFNLKLAVDETLTSCCFHTCGVRKNFEKTSTRPKGRASENRLGRTEKIRRNFTARIGGIRGLQRE